jgi:dihydrolipoamide dehydrogenase
VRTAFEGIEMPAVLSYQQGVVERLWKGLQSTLASRKIDMIYGDGRLTSTTSVTVNGAVYTGDHVVLATGSEPRSLPDLTLDGVRVISSDDALRLDRVPSSAIILGGGVIGVEFASVWRSFGADVTIVEMAPQLLPLEDEGSAKVLQRVFRRRGIGFELGAPFQSVSYTDSGVQVTLGTGKQLDAEVLLVAVGRGPVSAGLGYEENGVAMDRGYVLVDEYMRTNVPSISAVGDLAPTLQLAHVGFAEGILVAERLAGLKPVPIDYDGVPRVTYSNPEVASVGISEAKAVELYGKEKVVTLKYNLAGNGKSKILKTAGEIKLVQVKDGAVVGVHMVGARMGEQVGEAQLIYNWEALPAEVAQLIHAHPTQSEALGEAHLALAGKPLHAHD